MITAGSQFALAICDRCKMRRPHATLQLEQDTQLRVCPDCIDEPNPWPRAGLRPPDPVALPWARPETAVPSTDLLVSEDTALGTEDGDHIAWI